MFRRPEEAPLRSQVAGIEWPPVLSGIAAELLALQRSFDATQWWPGERLRAAQFAQLRHLAGHAIAQVPFMAARLAAAGIRSPGELTEETWRRVPVLTRAEVQREAAALRAPSPPPSHGEVKEFATGGSTGVPVRVYKTAVDALFWNAALVREELWHRPDPGGTIARLRSFPGHFTPEQIAQVRSPEGLIYPDWGAPHSFLWRTGRTGLIDYSRPAAEQVAFVQRLGAQYIQTNPSNLNLFLHHCREHGIHIPTLHSVWTLSEVVDPALRRLCRDVLGVPIIDNYSSAETGYLALQCPEHEHLHVQAETVLLEVVGADGQPCRAGETGRVLVTPLHNFAMPLLRYEIGDEAEVGAPCPCGRGLPVLTRILGRVMDHLTLPDGRKRRTDFRQYEFSSIRAIHEYQLVQRALDRIEFRMVVSRPLTPAEEAEVRRLALLEFGEAFAIELTYHAALPRTAAGKLRPFLSELP